MWLTQLFKDASGRAYDEMAVVCVLGVLAYVGLAIYHCLHDGQFDPQAYGIGFGACIGGACAGMGLKAKMEGDNVRDQPGER